MLFKILGGRLFSPSLKDVAWLEVAQIVFLDFFIGCVAAGRRKKITDKCMENCKN